MAYDRVDGCMGGSSMTIIDPIIVTSAKKGSLRIPDILASFWFMWRRVFHLFQVIKPSNIQDKHIEFIMCLTKQLSRLCHGDTDRDLVTPSPSLCFCVIKKNFPLAKSRSDSDSLCSAPQSLSLSVSPMFKRTLEA